MNTLSEHSAAAASGWLPPLESVTERPRACGPDGSIWSWRGAHRPNRRQRSRFAHAGSPHWGAGARLRRRTFGWIRDARESARPRARIAPRRARIAPPRDQILGAGEALTRLAEKLARPGPVTARGVAEALVLLRDGTGPLYNGRSDANLRGPATSAERNLGLDEP